jgi:hypothetical protein
LRGLLVLSIVLCLEDQTAFAAAPGSEQVQSEQVQSEQVQSEQVQPEQVQPEQPLQTVDQQPTPRNAELLQLQREAIVTPAAPIIQYVYLQPPKEAPKPGSRQDPATFHLHDGFYLQLTLGLGYYMDSVDTAGKAPAIEVEGTAVTGNFSMGGTPIKGVVIGGTFGLAGVDKPTSTAGGKTSKWGHTSWSEIGAFVDFYPDPKGNLHFRIDGLRVHFKSMSSAVSPRMEASGIAAAATVGYGLWISEQWSFEALFRVSGTRLSDLSRDEYTHAVVMPALLLAFAYH